MVPFVSVTDHVSLKLEQLFFPSAVFMSDVKNHGKNLQGNLGF